MASASLSIVKEFISSTISTNGTSTLRITIINAGPDTATNLALDDTFPSNLVIQTPGNLSTSLTGGASIGSITAVDGTGSITMSGSTIPNGGMLLINVDVTSSIATVYTNILSVTMDEDSLGDTGAVGFLTVIERSESDLAVVKTVDNATPHFGDVVTFTLTATNNGPDADTNVVLTDVLPLGYELISDTPSVGTYDGTSWTIGSMSVGSETLILVCTVINNGVSWDNTATITGDNDDPNLANNTSTVSVSPSCATITLTPASFSSGNTGTIYNQTISASGGTGPYAYTVTYGELPLGLSLDVNTGEITGIPEETTNDLFVITATDSNGCTQSGEYRINVTQAVSTTIPPYRSSNAVYSDHYFRLQQFMCCLGEKGNSLAKKLRISTDCCCDINTFELLVMYWSVLECYDPTAAYNCLTQQQIDLIWDDISEKCGLCFPPYGQQLINPRFTGLRITENYSRRITEDGFYREIE